MFYIRTDANPIIATGHVMRCMSIAKEISKLGEEVTFITADLQSQELIERNGFAVLCLDSTWNDLELEIEKLIEVIQRYSIKKLLIDSYFVTEKYLNELRRYTKLIYLDDLATFAYPVDVLINYNNYASGLGYEKFYPTTDTKLVLGCSYTPLRDEFRDIASNVSNTMQNVLVTTGGSDSYHVAYKFLQYMFENHLSDYKGSEADNLESLVRNIKFHVVVGKFNTDKEKLRDMAKDYPNIILHMDVLNMSELMKKSDLAITAGGSTMYELCACGVPMITYSFADNQLAGVKGFHSIGVAKYCGDIRAGVNEVCESIVYGIYEYCNDSTCRKNISNRMKNLVDGYGAKRIAEIIIN